MPHPVKDLDVRPILRDGGEPFSAIMEAVEGLAEGQALRLLATFKPTPLFAVLGKRGFSHAEREIDGGDWEITFTPTGAGAATTPLPATPPAVPPARRGATAGSGPGEADTTGWPAPAQVLDNRGLMPPEPMVLTLEAIEALPAGEVLEIHNDRDPIFLYPELAQRGHLAHRDPQADGSFRVRIRKGGAA